MTTLRLLAGRRFQHRDRLVVSGGALVLGFVGALASARLLRVVLSRLTDQLTNGLPGH